uniref:NB-ARC domain-containing protein n=1 Tax=Fusarium oxysporum (strain Fo5176) TaxID=660025 RepID=A0A0D2YC22_FUSOF
MFLGGLVCQDHLQDIVNFTRGVIFLGTPHHGSSLAKIGELVSRSVGLIKETNSDIVQVLTRDSEVLARIQDSFQALLMTRSKDEASMIDITCFYEELPTKKFGVIVPKHSAILPGYISIGIHKNHAEMTKFSNSEEPGFVAICGELKRWMKRIQQTQSNPKKHTPVTYFNWEIWNLSHMVGVIEGLRSMVLAESGYASIANEYKILGHEDSTFDALSTVRDWLESKESGKWLMVIDNADDMQLFFPHNEPSKLKANTESGMGQFIPQCPHGNVLITTRNMQVGSRLTKGKFPIEVGKMDENEATQLLRQGLQEGDESEKDLLELSSRLEFLPLALVQAAAFIQENSITVSEYLELLDGSQDDLVELLNEEFETVGRDSDTPRAVAQTWMLSFQQIERQYLFARRFAEFTRHAFSAVSDFYPYASFDDAEWWVEDMATCTAYLSHAKSVLEAQIIETEEDRLTRASVLHRVGSFFRFQGRYREAESLQREGLSIRRALLGEEHIETLVTTSDLAGSLADLSRFEESDKLQRGLIETLKRLYGDDHEQTLDAMANLAVHLAQQDKREEAKALQIQVVESKKRILGEEHISTIEAMDNLAVSLGDEEGAEMQRRVVEVKIKVFGEENPSTLHSKANLAMMLFNMGGTDLSEAEELQLEVFETRKRVLGKENPDTLKIMSDLGSTWLLIGQCTIDTRHLYPDVDILGDAKNLLEECVGLREKLFGADHADTVETRQVLDECLDAIEAAELIEAEAKAGEHSDQT